MPLASGRNSISPRSSGPQAASCRLPASSRFTKPQPPICRWRRAAKSAPWWWHARVDLFRRPVCAVGQTMIPRKTFMHNLTRRTLLGSAAALAALPARAADAPGITASEILIGQTMPYSGPASSYGTIGKASEAYFRMINDQGGIAGRQLRLLSLDDGYL